MNVPRFGGSAERALPDGGARSAAHVGKPLMLTWQGVAATRLESVINYTDADFSADITVDRDGMVIDFPGMTRRA